MSVLDLRTQAEAEKMALRIQAGSLRARLSARNRGERFRLVLAQLSDKELLAMSAEHHAWQVAHVAQRVEVRTELLVTSEMRLRAEKNNLRRRGVNGHHS